MSATSTRRAASLLFLGLVALIVVSYGAFEARKIVAGPELVLTAPKDGTATSSELVTVSGIAKNIAFLSINGAQAYTNSRGEFRETFSLPPGYTVVVVSARDRFGRSATRTARFTVLNYCSINS